MSNLAKKQARAKRLKKAKNMRKNNGIGRTSEHQRIHDAQEASRTGIGAGLVNGLKSLMGR